VSDERIKEAQQLFWQIETLRSLKVPDDASVIVTKLHRMASLHEVIAKERLDRKQTNGWIDLFAAITAWGEAGEKANARRLLRFGEQVAQQYEEGRESLLAELAELESWLLGLRQKRRLPSLARRHSETSP
jgi:hypothetical protein